MKSKYKDMLAEKKRQDFVKLVEDESKFINQINKSDAMEKINRRKDFIIRLQLERRESVLNNTILKAQEIANLQQNQLKQEEQLAAELDFIKRKEITDEKLRLHLRENSHELRELESQLRIAYINKALAAQLAEKEANKIEEQIQERRAREILEKAIGTLEEQEMERRCKEKTEKEKIRHTLQDQIIEKERVRQQEYISFMNDKKMFDDILLKIKNQEVMEMEEKKKMQQKVKLEMEQFIKAREMWKAKERLTIQEEDEKIKQINEEKAFKAATDEYKKKSNVLYSDQIYEKVRNDRRRKQMETEEKQDLLNNLLLHERDEKEKVRELKEKEKDLIRKQEARETYLKLTSEKNRKKMEEKMLDMKLTQIMKERMEEEERKEKEAQEKRRQVLINNRKYNEQAMRKNVQKRAEDLKVTQLLNEIQENDEKKRLRMIEEERIRMLREHAPKLLGFFPKGCLKDKDMEVLGITGNSPLPESCPLEGR